MPTVALCSNLFCRIALTSAASSPCVGAAKMRDKAVQPIQQSVRACRFIRETLMFKKYKRKASDASDSLARYSGRERVGVRGISRSREKEPSPYPLPEYRARGKRNQMQLHCSVLTHLKCRVGVLAHRCVYCSAANGGRVHASTPTLQSAEGTVGYRGSI